jgi:hypothetical protein
MAGFIALSVFISNLLFCRGTVCSAAQADVAFGAIEFLLWAATSTLSVLEVVKSGAFSRFGRSSAGNRRGQPEAVSDMKEAQLA